MSQILNNPQALSSMMNNPMVTQMLNNPQMLGGMMNNPMVTQMLNNPQMMGGMMNDPLVKYMMENPACMEAMMQSMTLRNQNASTGESSNPWSNISDDNSYENQLKQLEELGFCDKNRNLQVLRQVNGDVQMAVTLLLD